MSCGKAHTVAVLSNGHLYSWGAGACGQLGHPDTSSFPADEDGYPYQPIPRCVTVSVVFNPFSLLFLYSAVYFKALIFSILDNILGDFCQI